MLTKVDWKFLTNIEDEMSLKFIMITKVKFFLSFLTLFGVLIFELINPSQSRFYIILSALVVNIIALFFLRKTKKVSVTQNIVFVSFISFLLICWYWVSFIESTKLTIIVFIGLSMIYLRELESFGNLKIIIFSIYLAGLLTYSNIDHETLFFVFALLVFFVSMVFSNNKINEKVRLALSAKKNEEIFQKHTRLMEHKIINSITKLNYFILSIEDEESSKQSLSITKNLNNAKLELDDIAQTLRKNQKEEIEKFTI